MKKLLGFFVFFITFFALLNNANSVEQITYKDKKYEKLNFKEYGNFFGIKKNNNFYKGIFIGPKGEEGGQSDWYGFFTPKGAYHKGYFKHTYEDGRTLYQYTEYKLDETGEPFTIEENKFAISDQYLINEESFELVKKYLMYEIDMPYSFYNFETNKLETAEKNKESISEVLNKENLEFQKINYSDGEIYEGQIQNGTFHGTGTYKWKNGKVYEGEWKEGKFHGQGTLTHKKNEYYERSRKYVGQFKDGFFHGFGKLFYANGNIYEGKFENGKLNGTGKLVYEDGRVHEGKFKNDKFIGKTNTKVAILLCDPVFEDEIGEGINMVINLENKIKENINYLTETNCLTTEYQIEYLKRFFNYVLDTNYIDKYYTTFLAYEKLGLDPILYSSLIISDRSFRMKFRKFLINRNFEFTTTKIKEAEDYVENKRKTLNIKKKEFDNFIASLKNDNNKMTKIISGEKYYALVIGNNNYKHLEKLDAAENDAIVIADVLKNKYGFEVELLLNADQETTVDTLFNITNKLKKNDNLLIYYAGHGELDKAENRGYWLPVDASYEKRSKWISNQTIVDRIKATKAKHVLLVADSCFSGTLMRSGINPKNQEPIDEKYIERLKNKKTRLVITSGGNEPVVDSDGGNHSLFALKLIDTLKNNNEVINSQILFENIRRYVVANADQTPERAMVHKTGHDGGDFLFFPVN